MAVADVMKQIKKNNVKFVDFRFTDTKGKEQHVSVPVSAFKSYSIYSGAIDAMVQWWYGHNAVGFLLTAGFLGMMYYFVPKQAGRPVYSYRLSIVHFWALVSLYIWAGPHHLHYLSLIHI